MTITFGTESFENIPESYDETNLGKWIDVMKIQKKEQDFKSKALFKSNLLSTIIGCEVEYILELDIDDVNRLSEAFKWISVDPEIKNIDKIIIDDVIYVPKKNPNLTMGEQVSIETFLEADLSNVDNFHLVMAILLRPAIEKQDKYTKEIKWEIKPLEDDFNAVLERANMFKSRLFITDIYGILTSFLNGVKKSSMETSVDSSHLKIVKRNQNS